MKWTLIALAAVLLLSFPQLLALAGQPVVLALGVGVAADVRARRRRPVARDRRWPR